MRADPRFKPLPAEAATLLGEGKIIAAVKSLRESHGVDLAQAKEWIDAHLEQNPMLRAQLEAQTRAQRAKFFFWFLAVDAVIIVCVAYWFFSPGSP